MKVLYDLAQSIERVILKNYRQAQKFNNFKLYQLLAIERQVKSLEEVGVYLLVERILDIDVLLGKQVYDEKYKIDIKEYIVRTRWVICSNFKKDNWDFQDIYAVIANSVNIRLFLYIMAINDLEYKQFDFDTAFLNVPIKIKGKKYYVEQPIGLEKRSCKWVYQLFRALYSLKRSLLFWFQTLLPVLKALGFVPILADLCLLINNKLGASLVLYVDDFLVAAANQNIINYIKVTLEKNFKIKYLGPVRTFLGYDIIRNRIERTVFILQERYIKKIIEKFTNGLANG